MTAADGLEVVQVAIWSVVVIGGPVVLAATLAGVAVALLQALVQVQEMTLTFVPKITVVVALLVALAPFIVGRMGEFAHEVMGRIERVK